LPIKKKRRRKLSRKERGYNRRLSRERVVVEHTISKEVQHNGNRGIML